MFDAGMSKIESLEQQVHGRSRYDFTTQGTQLFRIASKGFSLCMMQKRTEIHSHSLVG